MQSTHTGPFFLVTLPRVNFALTEKAAVVEVLGDGTNALFELHSSTLISFCKAAIRSEIIHPVFECSLAMLRRTSVESFPITIGTSNVPYDLSRSQGMISCECGSPPCHKTVSSLINCLLEISYQPKPSCGHQPDHVAARNGLEVMLLHVFSLGLKEVVH